MKLEKQACSLDLAKKLKELGLKQKSRFYWVCEHIEYEEGSEFLRSLSEYDRVTYSAFTVAELGEMMPKTIQFETIRSCDTWHITTKDNWSFGDNTEANARARMLIYLLENKLITL